MKPSIQLIAKTLLVGVTSFAVTASAQTLRLSSAAAVVEDAATMTPVYSKNAGAPMPIASMTKLMTAMVVMDANLRMDEEIEIHNDDVDHLKNSSSRVPVGARFRREELLHLALMSSDNRAAHALARTYPGSTSTFVTHMNEKARNLQLRGTRFTDPTGLYSTNVATPSDVAALAHAAYQYGKIREYSSDDEEVFEVYGRPTLFRNTNGLVRAKKWPIELSKTGFIQEAGRCIVMRTVINDKPYYMVLMDSVSSAARETDARRIRAWLSGDTYAEPQVRARSTSKNKVRRGTKKISTKAVASSSKKSKALQGKAAKKPKKRKIRNAR